MRALIALALRNVLRNKSRSGFTVGAIAFGVLMSLLLGSFVTGIGNLMIDDAVRAKVGALQVHRRGYDQARDSQPLDLDLAADGELIAQVRAVPGVVAVAPRLVFAGLVNSVGEGGQASTMIVGYGVDPAQEYEVLPWAVWGLKGERIRAAAPQAGVLGAELARAMAVERGGSLTVQAATRDGQQNALDLDVAGTVDNNAPFESKRVLYVPLAYAQDLLQMPGRATELAVAVARREDAERVAEAVQARLGAEYHVQTWQELRPQIADVVEVQRMILMLVILVFLAIAVIGVVNTMLMSVLERTREIGTMLAVGVRRGQVGVLFLFEAAALALLGAGAGAGAAFAIIGVVAGRGGIALTPPGSTAIAHVVPIVPTWLIFVAVGASALGALLASTWPALRAARLRPVEALRAT